MSTQPPDFPFETTEASQAGIVEPSAPRYYVPIFPRPSTKSLILAIVLFLFTLCTTLAAGVQFAAAYAHHQAASLDEFMRALTLFYKNPAGLLAGLPFAGTLLAILLAHELGHFFACRHHHIHSTYPFFIPFPSLIGTFGAFILIRSPIRTTRALFDVGTSGPLIGFIFAVPALVYGVLHSTVVPALAHPNPSQTDVIFGTPLLLRMLEALFHPGVNPNFLLLPPIGRAAWVGLFATSLNLLPAGQLDGGHILRSVSPRTHRVLSWLLPFLLVALGYFVSVRAGGASTRWSVWYAWAAILFGLRLFRPVPLYDVAPLDPTRRTAAVLALIVFLISFMPEPVASL